jgi:RNA polymerase sigma factor (TIGR02999 family)
MRSDEISEIPAGIRAGRSDAIRDLLPIVYADLHAMAHRKLGGGRRVLLNTTELVHETYLKLFGNVPLDFQDSRHFYSVAAIAMKQIIVDESRRRLAARRGGGAVHLDVEDVEIAVDGKPENILALNDALSRLIRRGEVLAKIVEYHIFFGLTFEEIAKHMDMSLSTVKRRWREARARLFRDLTRDEDS